MSKNQIYVIAPGDTILELLEENNMTQVDLANKMGLTTKAVNEMIKGKTSITIDTALKLEYVFNLPFSFWMNLEHNYREALIRAEDLKQIELEIKYLDEIPYSEMAKRNWVNKTKDAYEKVINLRKFFSVASLNFNTELNNKINYRKGNGKKFSFNSLYCWIRYGEIKTIDSNLDKFDIDKLKNSIVDIRNLAKFPFFTVYEEIKTILAKCGVSLVYEPCLPNTYVNGIAYKMNSNTAIIMLSGRNKRDDSLWFTMFHEIGHLIKHSKKEIFIDEDNSSYELDIEKEADEFSKEILIPYNDYSNFVKQNNITKNSIINFSKQININTGILVGRLQKDGVIDWNKFNDLKIIIK